jgi:alcohol dehydrogenase class IV
MGVIWMFEFVTATRIIFGNGCLKTGIESTSHLGRKALVVHGTGKAPLSSLYDLLGHQKIEYVDFTVDHEPSVTLVQEITSFARQSGCDFVITIGGGSALDTGKAVAAMLSNPGDLLDYLEVVGKNLPLQNMAAPCVTIPTTSGTGTEVTRNAVLAVPEKQVKVSLRSNLILPALAIIDPELTYQLPAAVTAYTGMDALTQVIEPYVSIKHNPLMDVICRDGIGRSARSLFVAFQEGGNQSAREDLSLTSLYGGLALTNSGLGAVHGFAAPIGGMFDAHHGAVCGIILPAVFRMNIKTLKSRDPENIALERYAEVARLLTGNQNALSEDGADWLDDLTKRLNIPRLSSYGITQGDLPIIVEKAQKASSMKANPIGLSDLELIEILESTL